MVLKLDKKLAPIKIAVFPLLKNKPELVKKAREVYDNLKSKWMCEFDDNGNIDYSDDSKTENTRVSYPIEHIENYQTNLQAGHPKNIIFLTADAFGVLPPVSKLTKEQASDLISDLDKMEKVENDDK